MVLTPKNRSKDKRPVEKGSKTSPWVTWAAITLGVGMTGLGSILLFWGFAWQTEVGEIRAIEDNDLRGGPCLIPMGGSMIVIGILWILQGWRGFKKDKDREHMQSCPNCGKMIEGDLNFCYYCNTTFGDDLEEEGEEEEKERPPEEEGEDRKKRRKEPPIRSGKKARPFSPGER